jgi:hypothetical protein
MMHVLAPSGIPSTGSVRGFPLFAHVLVSMTTGKPEMRFAKV